MLDVGGKRKGRVAARVQHGSLGATGRVARKQMGLLGGNERGNRVEIKVTLCLDFPPQK